MTLDTLPLLSALDGARNVLLAGAGGGFDVFCGVPLYTFLRHAGVEVQLANLTFSSVSASGEDRLGPIAHRVHADSEGPDRYFPEKHLCQYMREQGEEVDVICIERSGVRQVREAYAEVARLGGYDAVVLVDGGTDSLMRGDEAGLGTPAEDAASLIAAAALPVQRKLLVCLGFGIDRFHGVCHAQFLEAVSALARQGAYLGAFSLLPTMPEVQRYLEACAYTFARMPDHVSIVNSSIASAIEGHFGDHHATDRTRGSELFINPLMSLYWGFELEAVVDRLLYKDLIADTETFFEVLARIEGYRHGITRKPWKDMPV